MQPYVTVVIPIYNVENYLEKCVSSVQNQTLKNIEIILVDDESPDNCPQICDIFVELDSRIRVIHKKNAGLGLARNSGIDAAQGQFIAFIDADDFIEPNMIEDLYKRAISDNADAVISGGFIYEFPNDKSLLKQDVKEEVVFDGNEKELPIFMMGAEPSFQNDYYYEMSACRGIYNTKLLKQNHIYFVSEREYISEDLLFHFDFTNKAKKVILVPNCYYHYRKNNNSLTKTFDAKRFSRNVDFYNHVLRYMDDNNFKNVNEKYKLYADKMLLARARVSIGQAENFYRKFGKDFKKSFSDVARDETMCRIYTNFPIRELPIKHRLFVLSLKHFKPFFCYILVWVNNLKNRAKEM